MIVVDTSVLIAHLRGSKEATALLRRHAARGPVLVPALAAWELWKGAESVRHRQSVRSLLGTLIVDPFMPAMAELAGEMHRLHREQGIERPAFDLLIASHAQHHRVPLATIDRDYSKIEGLDLIHGRDR